MLLRLRNVIAIRVRRVCGASIVLRSSPGSLTRCRIKTCGHGGAASGVNRQNLRYDHAAFSRSYLFIRLEAEDSKMAKRAFRLTTERSADGLTCVLYQVKFMLSRDFTYPHDICRATESMDCDYRARPQRDCGFDLIAKNRYR
jgi:hypothetical protein